MNTFLGSSVPNTCTQVAAASKSAPAPSGTIKDQLQARKPAADNRAVNDAGTHLKRLSTGELKADESPKHEASAALSIFKSFADKKAKIEFSKKILENRKSLQWCKTWQQKYEETTATSQVMVSGYMTRTHMNF